MSPRPDPLAESISASPWPGTSPPERILLIRFHALGDVALILPAAAALRQLYPAARIDLLTMEEAAGIPTAFGIFDTIVSLPRSFTRVSRLINTLRIIPALRRTDYKLVIDLQRNWVSRTIRRSCRASAWAEFDRFSLHPAADRVEATFRLAGIALPSPLPPLLPRQDIRDEALRRLEDAGWNPCHPLILLNPAGLWPSRNWPVQNYVQFCVHWLEREDATFLLVGTERIAGTSGILARRLGKAVIDLSGSTTLEQAIGLISWAKVMVTEDSGLLHMAWALGIPQVALFGSTNHVWAAPTGRRSVSLHSGDLPCGGCMEPECKYGDVHCLARHAPAVVYEHARLVMSSTS
jgi:heptosyltransferase II